MFFRSIAVLAAALSAVHAAPSPSGHVLHEKRESGDGWVNLGPIHEQTILPMRIGLAQSRLKEGRERLLEISDHTSEHYGKHMTAEEVIDFFKPSEEAVDAVRSWLVRAGIEAPRISQSVNKQWIQFDATAYEANKLLGTKYHAFEHTATGRTNVACDEYHVPDDLKDTLDYITPGIKLSHISGIPAPPSLLKKRSSRASIWGSSGDSRHGLPVRLEELPAGSDDTQSASTVKLAFASHANEPPADLSNCSRLATPDCIAALYNIPRGTTAIEGNELGIFQSLGDVYAQEDLDRFFTRFAPWIKNGTGPVVNAIDGAVAPTTNISGAGEESGLDLDVAFPIVYPQKIVLYQTDDPVYQANYNFTGFLNNFLDAIDGSYCTFEAYGIKGNTPDDPSYPNPSNEPGAYKGQLQCGVYKPTNVISISYGGAEADAPIPYSRRQCAEIMKLGMQGVTIVVSSGDAGVQRSIYDVNPKKCLGKKNDVFAPNLFADCPYVLSVGGTTVPRNKTFNAANEVATERFGSGGGFSNIYSRKDEAAWQVSAVDGYFEKNLVDYPYYESVDNSSFNANGGVYNRIGRAYPDVSALGDYIVIAAHGGTGTIGGTSGSAPIFASILTRINEERLAAGKKTVGFVNPVLYAHPEVFNDITVGNNSGCGTPGFFATKGWDPVTGLGTPDYPKLLKLFLDLQ